MKKKRNVKTKIISCLFDSIIVLANLFIVLFFYENIFMTTFLILCVSIIALVKWKSKKTFIIFSIGAIIGSIFEMICIYKGAWQYNVTLILNIPFWLPLLLGNASMSIYQFSRRLKEKKRSK